MADTIMLYPSLTDELKSRIRFQKSKFSFFYTDKQGKEYELHDEPIEAMSSLMYIKDENGVWTQDTNDFGVRRRYCLRTFQCLFGEKGIVCKDAELGLAIIWTSADSKQRGVIPIGTFRFEDKILEATCEKLYDRAQLRGQIEFTTVIYLAKAGTPDSNEKHLANVNGYILGELETYTIQMDGNGSEFPVYEVTEPGQPLWYVQCDWIDPTTEMFADCVSINLNRAHKSFRFIDREQKCFDSQLLAEIMASAVTIIVEKVRLQTPFWEQIMKNDALEPGSVGQAIYYFMNTLEWDMSSPESVSLCARKLFDQRM